MLLFIPSIEIKDNKSHLQIKGADGSEPYYRSLSESPERLIKLIRVENAKSVYIADKDSFEGKSTNFDTIVNIANSTDIPIQLDAKFENISEVERYLQSGVYRVILNSNLLEDVADVRELIKQYSTSRITFKLESTNGIIYNNDAGRLQQSIEFAKLIREEIGGNRIVYYHSSWDECEQNNYSDIKSLAQNCRMRYTLLYAVNNTEQLFKVQEMLPLGIDSVIVGKPLYENAFPCQRIWREIESELMVP